MNVTDDNKITGAEFKRFHDHDWPETWKIYEFYIEVYDSDGNHILKDDQEFKLDDFGWVADGEGLGTPLRFDEFYARFHKAKARQTLVTFQIADEANLPALIEAAKKLGAEVV